MEAALLGTVGVVAGACIALAGTFLAEILRERAERRQRQSDQRLQLYAQMVDLTQAARNNSYDVVVLGQGIPNPSVYSELASLRTRVELVASHEAVVAMSKAGELTHNDEHSAELAFVRRTDPAASYRSGRNWSLSDFDQWRDARDAMQNSFRADLGLPPLRLRRRNDYLDHENDVF